MILYADKVKKNPWMKSSEKNKLLQGKKVKTHLMDHLIKEGYQGDYAIEYIKDGYYQGFYREDAFKIEDVSYSYTSYAAWRGERGFGPDTPEYKEIKQLVLKNYAEALDKANEDVVYLV